MADDTFKRERRSGWGDYFLSRADDDSQWGTAASWRPQRNEDLSWTKFFWIFVFNFPFYFIALGLMGVFLSFAWAQQGVDGFLNIHSAASIGQFLLGAAGAAGVMDFFVCTILRNAWNRRARKMRDSELVVGLYE